MSRRLTGLISASVVLMAAGVAQAQTGAQTGAPAKPDFAASRPLADLANPLDPLAPMTVQAKPMESAVFARTALDHRFSRGDDVTGSLGFLCGLQPGHTESGGAAAYGSDPHGRFLGAKLSFAFR